MNISLINANLGLLRFGHWNAISSYIIERIAQMTFERISVLQGSDVSWISIVYLVSKAIEQNGKSLHWIEFDHGTTNIIFLHGSVRSR